MKNQNVEKELKILLTREQYHQLLDRYPNNVSIVQENLYFDTADQTIEKMQGALRIRIIENKHILTVKLPNDSLSKKEFERFIGTDDITQLSGSDKEWLSQYVDTGQPLELIHKFTTYRHLVYLENAELCIDKTDFNGIVDYELEYEYTKDHNGIATLNEIIKPLGIIFTKNGPSKIARASYYSPNL